jgi:hypothetical protein
VFYNDQAIERDMCMIVGELRRTNQYRGVEQFCGTVPRGESTM